MCSLQGWQRLHQAGMVAPPLSLPKPAFFPPFLILIPTKTLHARPHLSICFQRIQPACVVVKSDLGEPARRRPACHLAGNEDLCLGPESSGGLEKPSLSKIAFQTSPCRCSHTSRKVALGSLERLPGRVKGLSQPLVLLL